MTLPMRILLHSLNFFPELTGVGKYSGEMAFWFADRGHDVRVVAGHPFFPAWRVPEPYQPFEIRRESIHGVEVVRVPLWVPRDPGGVRRAVHLASFSLVSAPALFSLRAWSPEVVFTVVPTVAAAPWALALARMTHSVSWIHFQDLELDAAVDLGIVKSGWLTKALYHAEAVLLRGFHRVSTLSEEMASKLRSKGVSAARLYTLPNWIDPQTLSPGTRDTLLRRELAIPPEARLVLYSGSIGRKQGLEVLISLAASFGEDDRVRFLIAGEGPGLEQIKAQAADLENVDFIPLQPAARLGDLLRSADIHFLAQRPQGQGLMLPSKVLGMLASGRPILAAAPPRSALGALVAQSGFVRPHDDVVGLAKDLRRLLGNPALAASLGAAGRRLAMTRFSRDDILGRLESELELLARHPR